MAETDLFNPYQAPDAKIAPSSVATSVSTTEASLAKTVAVWTIVCSISAGPSFVWGYDMIRGNHVQGMVLGVLIFIVLYVVGDYLTRRTAFRKNPYVRRTLLIGYWTRLVVSIIFPVGLAIDLWAGMISVPLSGMAGYNEPGYGVLQVTWTTLVTGAVVNVFVFVYMLVVYGILYCFWRPKAKSVELQEIDYS